MPNTPDGVSLNLSWFKSSYSSEDEGDTCVEVAMTPGAIRVRDSKNARGPQFAVARTAWTDFIAYASEH